MKLEVVPAERLALRGARFIAATLRSAVAARGHATVAFSGGSTAGPLLEALAGVDVPWPAIDVLQVDERVAPEGHPDRNLTTLQRCLLDHVPLPRDHLHAMPVDAEDLDAAAVAYAATLRDVAGRPATLDLVHLGLGTDGHTASLVPDLPAPSPDETPDPVIVTPVYEGRQRLTLTVPVLSRARQVLWFVSGASKAPIVRRLVDGDSSILAGQVRRSRSLLLLDPDAAAELPFDSTDAASPEIGSS
ncbi:MAG: 6-phosphogluconolactonase [Gemmatimonadota bacterium]